MKILAGLVVISTSQDLRSCPDQNLADQCEATCSNELTVCLSSCSDAACQELCFNTFNNCSFRCPCNIFCPDGCVGCENEICSSTCPDQDLADECEGACSTTLGQCLSTCSDPSCQENCFNAYNSCSFHCPCNIFCPDGCEGCDSDFCWDGECRDEDLAEACEATCSSDLESCLGLCTGANCQEDCYLTHTSCTLHCPCNIFCPSGCKDCAHELCGGDGGSDGPRQIIHLGHPEGSSKPVFFATDEFGELFQPLELTLPSSGSASYTVLNGAGYTIYKNEVYSFGGYTSYGVPKTRILKFFPDECEFKEQSVKLIRDYYSGYGSIAVWDGGVWEPEGVYICFGTGTQTYKQCERFNGSSSSGVTSSRNSHRSGSMCVYDGRLMAIGGYSNDKFYTEMFDWEWNPSIPHPEGHSYADCLSMKEGVLLFSQRLGIDTYGSSAIAESKVWLFKEFQWNEVGTFLKSAAYFTALPLDNNTIMMYPGQYGKAAYRTSWDGEKFSDKIEEQLTNGQLRYDNTIHPIVFEGSINCPAPSA